MWHFLGLLDVSRDCAINVFSMSGLGLNINMISQKYSDPMKYAG